MSCGFQALISAAIVVFVGLPVFGLIFRAIRIARRFEKKDVPVVEPRREREREREREEGAPLAGEKCVGCKKRIVVERQAMQCRVCHAAVHTDCVARHSAERHA